MAHLHVKTPGGTEYAIDLDAASGSGSLQQNGWTKLPSGLIIQWNYMEVN